MIMYAHYHSDTDIVHMTRVREDVSQTIVNNQPVTTQKTKRLPFKKRRLLLALVKVLIEINREVSLLISSF